MTAGSVNAASTNGSANAAGATPRIDAHQHLWDLTVRPQPWTDPFPVLARSFGIDDLVPHLDEHHIDGTVLVQTVDLPEETPEMLVLADRRPEILGVVGWVDLQAPDVADQLAALKNGPGGDRLVGIRHIVQGEPDPGFLARSAVRRGLAAVADAGLVYDMLVSHRQLPAVVQAVRALPQLRTVLDHCGKPDLRAGISDDWRRDILALSREPSVAVKLSGLVTEADHDSWTPDDLRPAAATVLDAFGPHRVMFGTDWPACLPAADYGQVVATADILLADMSADERAQVYGGTSVRWYRLSMSSDRRQ